MAYMLEDGPSGGVVMVIVGFQYPDVVGEGSDLIGLASHI